jgi:hypothetical protein
MRIRIWDVLAVIFLLAAIAAGVVYGAIFSDPYTNLNPFPPPTMPSLLVLPSATNTPVLMATTWTPRPGAGLVATDTLAPSSTPQPSSTSYVLPSPSDTPPPTPTDTVTPTVTRTPTKTYTPTQTKIPTITRTLTSTLTPSDTVTPTQTQGANPP